LAGHDVLAITEIASGSDDVDVLRLATADQRVLLTEDRDFGQLTYAAAMSSSGVILIRFPGTARQVLSSVVVDLVNDLGEALTDAFVVLQPGRVRISRPSSH
jgi:predicted nuclease of predicted toxin-antitoxin system